MSMLALLTATRNAIRSGLTIAAKDCDITPINGQPPPMMGVYYYGVHESAIAPEASYSTFEEVYSIAVTITLRMRGTPWDRMVQKELYGAGSLDARCRAVAALIHKDTIDNRIINAANLLIDPPAVGYVVQGFVEPLRLAGIDNLKEVGPTWFHATMDQIESDTPPVGWAKTIRFTGARRVQESEFAN